MFLKLIGKDTDIVRVNWVKNALAALPPGARLLDAGAGELRFKQHCSHLEYVSQDFAQYHGEGTEGLQTGNWSNDGLDIVSDITQVPVPDQSFDAILCTEVLEHVPDALAALTEFSRILRPGGTLLITAPFASLTHFAPYHFCGFNKYWYQYHMPKLGFQIQELQHNGSWFHFVAQELLRSRLIVSDYSKPSLAILTKITVIPIVILLTILSRFDRGSHEVLCFNYMVRAIKSS